MAEIVEDGLYLKKLLETIKSEKLTDMKQLKIMETILQENIIIREKEINGKIFIETDEIEKPKQTIFDPRDESIKFGKKGKFSWVGSKCHIVETAEKGEINFITNMIQQSAPAGDILKHREIQEGNKRGLNPEMVFVDQSYMSGEAIKFHKERDQKLMGYMQKNGKQRQDIEYQQNNFQIKASEQKAICPMGKESIYWRVDTSRQRQEYMIYFNREDCLKCSSREKCLKGNETRRKMAVSINYDHIQQRREEQKETSFQGEMKVRAQVEGTISELVRNHNLRRTKYKGEKGRELQYLLSATGLNIKRLLHAITYGKTILTAT